MSAGVRLVLPGAGVSASPLTRFVALSLGVHVVATAAIVLMPALGPTPSISETAWAVELVAAAPPPRPSRSAATPPPQRSEPQPAPPRPEPERRVEIETPPPTREREAPPRPAADPTPAPPPGDPPPGAPAGASGPIGAGDESASVTALEVADFRYAWYRNAVTAALYGNWRKPVLAGNAGPREVRVSFEIARDGSVRGLRVESPSGLATLDRSALRAVADAAPFPSLPAGWGSSSLPAAFVFRLYPE